MLHPALICGVTIAIAVEATSPKSLVLKNEHLVVRFAWSAEGPRLSAIEHRASGEAYRFGDCQEVAMVVLPPEAVHDADLAVRYEVQEDFRFEGVLIDRGATKAVFDFGHDLLRAKTVYELQPDAPILRKTLVCTAGNRGAYVAGVTHWMLEPEGLTLAWPRQGTFGQPAVLLQDASGCFLTLEWPSAKVTSVEGDVRVAYRPAHDLAPGQTRQVAAGSIGWFPTGGQAREAQLEAARQAFFAHVADRVQPCVPFPVKFTTWGPWLGQAREDRILEILDDLAYVGVDLFHFDAGWQQPDFPYSRHFPQVRDADDRAWDLAMTQPERLPRGLLPIVEAVNRRGMKVSLWFDACGNVFVREGPGWAIRDAEGRPVSGRMWEGRWPEAPRQSLASEYGDRLAEFVFQAMDRYDLGGIMFDNQHYTPDHATDRRSLANGFNAVDAQLQKILEILDEAERRRPGLYRFFCRGVSWPWALMHATHIHAGDPGTSELMRKAVATDYPARALAFERRLAWQRHYDHFVPPWGIKGDIAGWSVQQRSAIPVNLEHSGQLIASGEGWTQNMFTCFATTAVRDVRFSFRQMPEFDRDVLKEWLAWDRKRSQFIFNCRPILKAGDDPNRGIDGYSHVGDGRGVIYLFNRAFDRAVAKVLLDERVGFRPRDVDLPAHLVYPMRVPLGSGELSYGTTLRVPILGKDCVVIEVGLKRPAGGSSYAEYEEAARSVRRSFDTVFRIDAAELFEGVRRGPVRVEVGDSPRDLRLAAEMLETLGAAAGRRLGMDRCLAVRPDEAASRLIIGSHEGLIDHDDVGQRFRETLYNRYVAWDGKLISAPLAAELPGSGVPTFCLIAPRPEQLARLATNLTSQLLAGAQEVARPEDAAQVSSAISFRVDVPAARPLLRFRPVVRQSGHKTVPGDLKMIRLEIEAGVAGERRLLWSEDVPPFCGPQWWQDRVISIADLAGQDVTFHFTARHVDGRGHSQITIGFDRVAVLAVDEAEIDGQRGIL